MFVLLQSGYYLPDAELVKENYRVQQPPVTNLSPFGYYIWRDCRRLNTYLLQKIEHQPIGECRRRKMLLSHTAQKKVTIHQVTTMFATSKNVLFPGHNHLPTTGPDDSTLNIAQVPAWITISLRSWRPVVSRWLWLGNRKFLEVASMVVT